MAANRRPFFGRPIRRRTALQTFGAGAALAAFGGFAACGDDDDDDNGTSNGGSTSTSTAGGSTTTSEATQAAGQPVTGGNFSMAYSNIPQNLDFHKIVSPTLSSAACLVMNRLLRYKTDPSVDPNVNEVIGDVAADWEQADDVTYNFTLRPEAVWQDKPPYDGRPLVAEDIIRSYERQMTDEASFIWAYLVNWIDSMEAPDDHTLVIKAKAPFALALDNLALYQTPIAPMDCVDQFGDLATPQSWVGSGPYVLSDWRPGVGFVMERNPNNWEPDSAFIDRFDFKEIPDASTRLSAFLAGDLDYLDLIEPEVVSTVEQSVSNAQILKSSNVGGVEYAWTMEGDSPFADPRVRKAWDLIVDREAMVRALVGEENVEYRVGPLSPGFPAYTRSQDEIKGDMETDVERAKALLEEAGYADGFSTSIIGNSADEKAWAEWAVERGKEVGIEITPNIVERTVYITAQREHNFDLGQIYAIRGYPDPDEYLYPLYYTGASKNYFEISDPDLDELILKQRQTLDLDERKQVLQEIDSRWTTDFNYHTYSYTEFRNDALAGPVQGFVPRSYDFTQLRYTWLEQE